MADEDIVAPGASAEEEDFKAAAVEPADEEAEAAAAEATAAQDVAAAAIEEEPEAEDVEEDEEIPEHPFGGAPAQVVMVEGSNAFEARKQAAIAKRIDSKK